MFLAIYTKRNKMFIMFFVTINNINIRFIKKVFILKTYIIINILSIIKKIQIINKNIFVIIILDLNKKKFLYYIFLFVLLKYRFI